MTRKTDTKLQRMGHISFFKFLFLIQVPSSRGYPTWRPCAFGPAANQPSSTLLCEAVTTNIAARMDMDSEVGT